ncbi:MAG TPA: DNRLRE domain-containing protein [Verrucomicrobiae bacterium]|nr:DNRLRE domain-containing protein [Verrucomicrobiae bacterium]
MADTSLLEVAPTNNLGGYPGMNAGTTQEYQRTRALMRFDFSSLPTNTVILSAAFQIDVTRQPDEPPNHTTFGLHRMLRPWGEGNKSPVGQQAGKGLPASFGEATWECAFHPTNAWTVPGGAPDIDFSSVESSSQFIYGTGESPYRFETSPELVADITTWVRQPTHNHGWMLLCNEESVNFTARRFSTREDSLNSSSFLELQYLVPPQFESIQRAGSQCNLSFIARAGQSYGIQYCDSFTSSEWLSLTAIPPFSQDTNILFIDTTSAPQRFYRLETY